MLRCFLYILLFLFSLINSSFCSSIKFKCNNDIRQQEQSYGIPRNLLCAIANVESAMNPNAIYYNGKSYHFKTANEAKTFANRLVENGVKNFDIGLMQINYGYHHHKFDSLDHMLDPESNLQYGARFLNELYSRHKAWRTSVAYYNSSKLEHQRKYTSKILKTWVQLH